MVATFHSFAIMPMICSVSLNLRRILYFFKVPMARKSDHSQAIISLAKLSPGTLHPVTARLPAALLVQIRRFAEEKDLDLASALREVATLGLEAAASQGALSPADRKEVKRWEKDVERALRDGKSPFEPFFPEDHPNVKILPPILAKIDYAAIYPRAKQNHAGKETLAESMWKLKIEAAKTQVKPLMLALENLENRFLARMTLHYMNGPEEETRSIHWLLSDPVMKTLAQSDSDDPDIEAVRQLIVARTYLLITLTDHGSSNGTIDFPDPLHYGPDNDSADNK